MGWILPLLGIVALVGVYHLDHSGVSDIVWRVGDPRLLRALEKPVVDEPTAELRAIERFFTVVFQSSKDLVVSPPRRAEPLIQHSFLLRCWEEPDLLDFSWGQFVLRCIGLSCCAVCCLVFHLPGRSGWG